MESVSANFMLYAIIAFAVLMFFTIVFIASRYRRCPSDKILVVYGKVQKGRSSKTLHGGGAFVWPLIQDSQYLSLTPMTINIDLKNALSQQNIRINVPSTFTVGISTDPAIMSNAAERLLGLRPPAIMEMAREIIFGQLRLTVALLTIEQINQDRESFLESIRKNVEPELNKIGLYLINVNITDITDESDYIESIGKKAAAEAINKAKVDVADQEKKGAIGAAEANREKDIRVAENFAAAEKGKKSAEADQRIFIQQKEAEAIVGEANANREKEVEKKKIEIAAEAEAERTRREAKGDADAILLKYKAEAEGIKKLLDSKAEGYASLVESCGKDAKAAATLLMIEKIEELVEHQVKAIQNLKIDKITVWDSGGGDGKSSSTANFLANMLKAIPPMQDVASMAGVELPEFLGKIVEKPGDSPSKTAAKKTEKTKPEA